MLTHLRVKNLGLVADLTLEFQPGYNVVTGETGAGKSMVIGALNLVLGERADRSLIRSGSDNCSVEAVFDTRNLKAPLAAFLEENGLEPCEDWQLVLKRVFTAAGANRQFINGSPTTLTILAAAGQWLVDIHGPHEHQSLLQPAKQLALLDAFGNLEDDREAFSGLVRQRAVIRQNKAGLVVDERTFAHKLDLLRFQIREIEAASLRPGEDEEVEAEHRRASNAARLLQLGNTALEMLGENENSLLTQAGIVGRALQELRRLDPAAAFLAEAHEQLASSLSDLQSEISRYCDKVEVEPARLAELEERLNTLQNLKRKYGPGLAEVIEFAAEAKQNLQSLEQRDGEIARLNEEEQKLSKEILRAGRALSARRAKVIPQLTKFVCRELSELGFAQSRLDIELRSPASDSPEILEQAGLTGLDSVEVLFAPNPGEPPRPLRAIASSGELARVMLALKTVLAAQDQVPVLIFDEVDANIGGETAQTVGEKMQRIARNRQVLCITHLPQVASAAGAHYVVTKSSQNGRTISEVRRLPERERVTELARMLGGQTDAARKHAEALLKTGSRKLTD